MILLLLMKDAFKESVCVRSGGEEKYVVNICRLICIETAGLVVYFIILKISLFMTGIQLSSYQGANSIFEKSLINRISRIPECYLEICRILLKNETGLIGNRIIRMILGFCLFFSLIVFWYLGRKIINKTARIAYFGILLLLPIGVNLIYPMTTDDSVIHPIMRYSMVFLWILPIFAIELYNCYGKNQKFSIFKKIAEISIVIIIINYIYGANIVYTKVSFLQEQTNAYYTVLITQIKSCEGYQDEMPVLFIGAGGIQDETLTVNDEYRTMLTLATNDLQDWINDYSYIKYMRYHCGFEPEIVGRDAVKDSYEEVKKMPNYPDYGSIKVIDNVVVVKMSEIEQ